MVIGIVPDRSKTETLLNNLSEADFKLKDVSVITRDVKARQSITDDAGPLKGIAPGELAATLAKLGMAKDEAQAYADAILQGWFLVAVAVPHEAAAAAAEMLRDASAEKVRTLG